MLSQFPLGTLDIVGGDAEDDDGFHPYSDPPPLLGGTASDPSPSQARRLVGVVGTDGLQPGVPGVTSIPLCRPSKLARAERTRAK